MLVLLINRILPGSQRIIHWTGDIKSIAVVWAWWGMPVIPPYGREREEGRSGCRYTTQGLEGKVEGLV
jgi:hypothetical protein